MKKNYILIYFLLIIAIILAITNSCKKDEEENPIVNPPTNDLILQKPSALQFEIINIYAKSIIFSQNSYNGIIGNVSTEFYKSNDTTLCFIVPNSISGVNQIRITIDNIEYKMDISIIQANTIQDPVTYINNFQTDINNDMLELKSFINLLIADSSLSLLDGNSFLLDIENIKDSINIAMQLFNNLTESEKQQAVQLFNTNRIIIDNINNSIYPLINSKKKSGTLSYEEKLAIWYTTFNQTIIVSFYAPATGWVLGTAFPVVGPKAGMGVGALFSKFYFREVYEILGTTGAILSVEPWASITTELLNYKSAYINNVPKQIVVKIKHRNISEIVDQISPNNYVKEFTISYRKFINYWNQYLAGNFSYIPKFATTIEIIDNVENINNLSLQIADNNNVTGFLNGTPTDLKVTFSTNQNTNQNFSYKITYTKGSIQQISNTINGTLSVAPQEANLIQIYSGNNLTSNSQGQLPEPIKVKVLDANNNPMSNVTVYFSLSPGCGVLSQSQVITDATGIVSTSWTLNIGGGPNPQTLTAWALKSDGVTYVNGSPLTFTATTPSTLQQYSISIYSGNNQSGSLGSQLANPLKVIVKNINGSPVAGVNVNFTANNGGSVSQTQITTGADGIATVNWTLGSTGTTQTATVTAYKSDNVTPLVGSPLTFTATDNSIVIDFDGNIYDTVVIGTQTWFKQNLKVTHYRNGNPIPNTSFNYSGAYYDYNNTPSNSIVYGRFYNFYAVVDPRNLCPLGWHVPTNTEWTTLTTYLGGESIAGGKLKEAGFTHWNSPNTEATNQTGFTAIPAGYRESNGTYEVVGNHGYWWSSTETISSRAWYRILYYNGSNVTSHDYDKFVGFSVRCLKN